MQKKTDATQKDIRGQSLVEFGLMAPLYTLLLFGSIQMLFLPHQQAMMEKATWEAARAAVTSTSTDTAQIDQKITMKVNPYARFGFFGKQSEMRSVEYGEGYRYAVMVVPDRLLYGLGGICFKSGWEKYLGAKGWATRGGSYTNYKGPLPRVEEDI